MWKRVLTSWWRALDPSFFTSSSKLSGHVLRREIATHIFELKVMYSSWNIKNTLEGSRLHALFQCRPKNYLSTESLYISRRKFKILRSKMKNKRFIIKQPSSSQRIITHKSNFSVPSKPKPKPKPRSSYSNRRIPSPQSQRNNSNSNVLNGSSSP